MLLVLPILCSAYVEMDFKISNSFHSKHALARRQVEPVLNASLTTSYNFYHGSLFFGNPAQEIEVLLDTGSPITWVYGPNGSFNNATMFYPNESTTFSNVNFSLSAAYGSGQYLGYWGHDTVAAPQFVSNNVTYNSTNSTSNSSLNYKVPFDFGIVTDFATSAGAPGLLGLGPHIGYAGPQSYLSLPEAYFKYNITSSPIFSIFLEENDGRFLFGGVDLRYAELPLYRFPVKKPLTQTTSSAKQVSTWSLNLNSIRLNNYQPYQVSSNVILDTGSPVNLLPPGFVDAVGKSFNLTKYGRYETYYTNGSTEHIQGNLTFKFGSLEFDAPVRNFLVPGQYVWLDDGPQNATALSLMGSSNYLLGDAFFKSVYTVLDPSTGDVILGKRTLNMLNVSNSTNASSVVPFAKLQQNISAVLNASALAPVSTTTVSTYTNFVTVSSVETVTVYTPVVVQANQYLGTVPAEKAASMTAAAGSNASSSATSTSTSTSTSTKKENSGRTLIPSCLLLLLALFVSI